MSIRPLVQAIAVLCLASMASCKRDAWPTDATAQSAESLAVDPDTFVGCRPSAGECAASCAHGKGIAVPQDPRCSSQPYGQTLGCYCGTLNAVEAPPAGHLFVGCRRGGDCQTSCSGRNGIEVRDGRCPEASSPIADKSCYCPAP